MLEQRRDDRTLRKLQRDGDRGAAEALPQLLRPGPDGERRVLDDGPLALLTARRPQANVVLLVRPVEPDEGGEGLLFLLVHVDSSRTVGGRDMRTEPSEGDTDSRCHGFP